MNLKIYKSSAGSGKTFTLVGEYLSLALESDYPQRYKSILAITFTNKAANEMKERVIRYLKAFSGSDELKGAELLLFQQLKQKLSVDDITLKNRAENTLQTILHQYSDFNISTIDKFILKIIRSFSFDLQLPINFDVEMDTESVIETAVENVIAEVGKNKELTEFLIQYVGELADDDQAWSIQDSLVKVAKNTLSDGSEVYMDPIRNLSFHDFLKIKHKAQTLVSHYEKQIKELLNQGVQLLQTTPLEVDDFEGKSKGSIYAYFFKPKKDFEFSATASGVFEKFEKENWIHKEAQAGAQAHLSGIQSELYDLFHQIENLKSSELKRIVGIQNISKFLFQLALINEIEKKITDLKKENNFIHISEFNKKVSEIVIQQPIPFIYERIGERYKNYLLDEFQDTSELQWQNLMPLIENSLANGQKNLVVGDVKQAIYRWRGGNVDQFQNIQNHHYQTNIELVDQRLSNIRRYIEMLVLNTNYRSLPVIIQFNNLFFETLLPQLSFEFEESYYSDYKQLVGSEKLGGYVEISEHESKSKNNFSDDYLEFVLNIIQDALARGKSYQDIAILARDNESLIRTAEYLTAKHVPVLSSVSLSLAHSPEVNFVVSIFRVHAQGQHVPSLLCILNFLAAEGDLPKLQLEILGSKADQKNKLLQYLDSNFGFKLEILNNLGIFEALELIIRSFKISKMNPFIHKILDVVNSGKFLSNLDFVNWWDEKKSKTFISSPENINAVSLLTIHKAKGLEFPVVIFPFANAPKGNQKKSIWVDTSGLQIGLPFSLVAPKKELAETLIADEYFKEEQKILLDDLNNVYVALTRPVEELYVLISKKQEVKKEAPKIDTIEKFFYPVLEKMENQNGVFSMGTKPVGVKAGFVNNAEQEWVKNYFADDWKSKIKLSFQAPSIWDVPLNSNDSFEAKDPRKTGNLVHLVFSLIKPGGSLEVVLSDLIESGQLEQIQMGEIKMMVENVLKIPLINKIWSSPTQWIEQEFIRKDGRILRPDRIILHDGVHYLLDFKTGEEKPADHKQMNEYASLLQEMGFQNIQKVLIYTELGKIVTQEP